MCVSAFWRQHSKHRELYVATRRLWPAPHGAGPRPRGRGASSVSDANSKCFVTGCFGGTRNTTPTQSLLPLSPLAHERLDWIAKALLIDRAYLRCVLPDGAESSITGGHAVCHESAPAWDLRRCACACCTYTSRRCLPFSISSRVFEGYVYTPLGGMSPALHMAMMNDPCSLSVPGRCADLTSNCSSHGKASTAHQHRGTMSRR